MFNNFLINFTRYLKRADLLKKKGWLGFRDREIE